ncbi:SIR2 family protein [Pseudarthrobacter sp. NPDC055928]|uniref:SIR2 family protein n=1 Tax=Pseudarthrobacter sp. NPDC055928 TaxID=3345661 RepID=UPI0035D89367
MSPDHPPHLRDVAAALELIKGPHSALLEDVMEGDRVLWLGSGISRNQVPPLAELIQKVLVYLQEQSAGNPGSPFRKALSEIVHARFSDEIQESFDADPAGWTVPSIKALEPYVEKYASILNHGVGDEPADFLLWTAVDIRATYGSSDIRPGQNHRLIAILMHEGVLPHVVTTNWDGLIESSYRSLMENGSGSDISVLMTQEDFRAHHRSSSTRLYKIHGCAVRANDGQEYRDYLVADTLDIVKWGQSGDPHQRILQEVTNLMTDHRTLVLGLSFQDNNLIQVHANATFTHPWKWEEAKPAYVVADRRLQDGHTNILKSAYGNDYTSNRALVQDKSLLPLYAEPLLAALVIRIIGLKIAALLRRMGDLEDQLLKQSLLEALDIRQDLLSRVADSRPDLLESLLTHFLSPLMRLYHGDSDPLNGYLPIIRGPLSLAATDPAAEHNRLPEAASVVGLLNYLDLSAGWRVRFEHEPDRAGLVRIDRYRSTSLLIAFVKDEHAAAVAMKMEAWQKPLERIIVARLTGTGVPRRQRSPRGNMGTARRPGELAHEVVMNDVWQEATSSKDLITSFSRRMSI